VFFLVFFEFSAFQVDHLNLAVQIVFYHLIVLRLPFELFQFAGYALFLLPYPVLAFADPTIFVKYFFVVLRL
jgi:hypothetical protein